MTRFLHTSDWQMGMKAIHAGEMAKEVRNKRYDAASNVAKLAHSENVDFVLICGDLFEHHDVDEVHVKRTVDVLNEFEPIPVFVLPGNHDPNIPGGVWGRKSWNRVGNHVVLLTSAKEVVVGDGIVLYPCPLTQKQSNKDPTEWIPERREGDERIRIGIAHGSLDILPEVSNFPIDKDRPESVGLDYLALGDWHSFLDYGRTVYSGAPEPTDYTEKESGNAVIVEIEEANQHPVKDIRRTGILIWAEFEPTIAHATDVEKLEEDIEAVGTSDIVVIRVNAAFDDDIDNETIERLETLRKQLDEEIFRVEWLQDSEMPDAIDPVRDLPEGTIQCVDEALLSILNGEIPEGPGQKYAGQEPVVVREALHLLHRIAREVKR